MKCSLEYHVSITTGADKYLCLLQSPLTSELMPIVPFPIEDKRQMLVVVSGFSLSVKEA